MESRREEVWALYFFSAAFLFRPGGLQGGGCRAEIPKVFLLSYLKMPVNEIWQLCVSEVLSEKHLAVQPRKWRLQISPVEGAGERVQYVSLRILQAYIL